MTVSAEQDIIVRDIIKTELSRHPLVERAYLTDVLVHQQVEQMARTLTVVASVMRNQGIGRYVAERVLIESVRVPFDQYIVEEQQRSALAARLAAEFKMPVHVIDPTGDASE